MSATPKSTSNTESRFVEAIYQLYQLSVFEVDFGVADTKLFFPGNQAHRMLKPPFSGLNVIVR